MPHGSLIFLSVTDKEVKLVAQDATGGAAPLLFAATAQIRGGGYAKPGNRRESGWRPVVVGQ